MKNGSIQFKEEQIEGHLDIIDGLNKQLNYLAFEFTGERTHIWIERFKRLELIKKLNEVNVSILECEIAILKLSEQE